MDKPKVVNGFTMIEMLVVLSVICIFSFSFSTRLIRPSLSIFVEKMMHLCCINQEKAFIEKEEKDVEIQSHYALFDQERWDYPKDIVCNPYSFHYNSKGNINKAGTITCWQGNQNKKLIFQLGSGRVRVE